MRVAIFRKNLGKYSESFVRRNLERVNGGDTVAVCVHLMEPAKFDWIPKSRVLVLKRYPRCLWKQVIRLFFLRHHVQAAVVEFLDWASEMAPTLDALHVPYVALAHGYDVGRNLSTVKGYQAQLLRLRKARKILMPSQFLEAILTGNTKLNRDLITTIPIGVDTRRFCPDTHQEKGADFLFIGRFVEKKAPLVLLLAVKAAQDQGCRLSLRLGGDGPLLAAARQLATTLKIHDQVTFLGVLSKDQVIAEINRARCLVLPSVTAEDGDIEGMPIIIQEAISLGTPVIATSHSGIPEVIINEETGYLVGEHDYQATAGRMIHMATLPESRYKELCAQARQRAVRHFDENSRIALIDRCFAPRISPADRQRPLTAASATGIAG